MWSVDWVKGMGERAIKTFFQCAAALLVVQVGGDLVPSAGVEGVNWVGTASTSLMAAVLSIVTSIGNADFTAGVPRLPVEWEEPSPRVDEDLQVDPAGDPLEVPQA